MALHRHHRPLTSFQTRSVLDGLPQVVAIAGPAPVGADVLLRIGDGQPLPLGDRSRVLTVVVGPPQVVTGPRGRTVEVVLLPSGAPLDGSCEPLVRIIDTAGGLGVAGARQIGVAASSPVPPLRLAGTSGTKPVFTYSTWVARRERVETR